MEAKDCIPGVKVKIPKTRKEGTWLNLAKLQSEVKDHVPYQDYLIIFREPDEDGEVGVCFQVEDDLKENLIHLDDLEPYEEVKGAAIKDIPNTLPSNGETLELIPEDPINPTHYQGQGKEVIEEMVEVYGVEKVKAFCEVNAYKYFRRAGKKEGNPISQDLDKAKWYLTKLQELNG